MCTYDRAGLSWSDSGPRPRTQQDMVENLHKLLVAEGFKRPLVLVGHSMAGLLVRLYAGKYPADVADVVVVDASPESIVFAPGAAQTRQGVIAQVSGALGGAVGGLYNAIIKPIQSNATR